MATFDDDEPTVLLTERICLRPLEARDADAVFAFKADPQVTSCYGQEAHTTMERTREWVGRNIKDQRQGLVIYWAMELRESGEVIGACCLWNFNDRRSCAEVGYELHPSYWRRGLMTEALSAILDHGFDRLGLHRIEASPLATNEASIGLLFKLGFRHEGTLRQRQPFRDRYIDQWYLGLLRDEWTCGRVRHVSGPSGRSESRSRLDPGPSGA